MAPITTTTEVARPPAAEIAMRLSTKPAVERERPRAADRPPIQLETFGQFAASIAYTA